MMFSADLGQPVDVGLARAVVAALDGVVEEPVDRVAVALVVLGRVDAALGGDRVRAARGVLVAERLHHVAGLAERGRGRGAGQAGADDDDREPAAVGRVGDPGLELAGLPALLDRAAGRLGVADRLAGRRSSRRRRRTPARPSAWCEGSAVVVVSGMSVMACQCVTPYLVMTPARTKIGTSEKPPAMTSGDDEADRLALRRAPRVVGQAQGLRGAPHAVAQVHAQRDHREQVDQRQPPDVEGVDQQVVRVVGRPAGTLTLPM